METGGLIYLVACAIIFVATGGHSQGGRPLGWQMTLLSLGARAFLSVIAIPLTILLCIEHYIVEPLFGVRVLQMRQNR